MHGYSAWTFWIGLSISVVVIALIAVAFGAQAWEEVHSWRRRRRLERDPALREYLRMWHERLRQRSGVGRRDERARLVPESRYPCGFTIYGAYRDRTGDLRLAKPALSQLS